MQKEMITQYSEALRREMHVMVYGYDGVPFLCFPTQDSMCHNYEDFGMTDQLADWINDGRIQLYVVDTVDRESWSAQDGDKAARAERQEQYFHYIVDETVPLIQSRNPRTPAVTGFSMGANHSVITFLRRPELFRGVIALSGVYDTDYFFQGWMNPTLYDSAPDRFLPNMPADHPYVKLYNERKMILCVGQGAWEEDGVRSLRYLETVFREKGIHAWCDFWGFDVNHDWPWWFKQMRYFVPKMIEG
ncbi:MAG: esterase family protein [Clostridia bacterium]|nr:esterase family protein [Clostridia bacterium]